MIFLECAHLADDDVDYMMFDSYQAALRYIQLMILDYDGRPSYEFTLSTLPINLPESEYTLTV